MFIDFSNSIDSTFHADVCVIGAGAAGFACALSFLDSNLKVLVLEGGMHSFNSAAADLHSAKVRGQAHFGINEARERIVGGTTTTWGGQAYPFLKEDFQVRPHLSASGWPITLKDLEPYYSKAEIILGTDVSTRFDYRPWGDWGIEEPAFSSGISLFVTKWCKVPNFAEQHGKKIEGSKNVHILCNANVIELLPDESCTSVAEVKISSLAGKRGLVRARYFIAAGGAFESVRLFLASTAFAEKALTCRSELVGRYIQDHVGAVVGRIIPDSAKKFHQIFDPFYRRGFKYLPRIRVEPDFAEGAKILHTAAQIIFTEGEKGLVHNAKSIFRNVRKGAMPSFMQLRQFFGIKEIAKLLGGLYRWKFQQRGLSAKGGAIWLEIHAELEPRIESYLKLCDQVDTLGMKRLELNWHISDLTVASIRKVAKLIASEFENAGIGKIILEPWVDDQGFDPRILMYDTYHQAGGLRMSDNEQNGVVDPHCKVFGLSNLYVASSAVFPTSSFSNPTLTTIALAIRICETIHARIKNEMSGGRVHSKVDETTL